MARVNIYLPDEMARESREAGLNVSSLAQEAIRRALAVAHSNTWLEAVAHSPSTGITHEEAMRALEGSRDDLGRKGG